MSAVLPAPMVSIAGIRGIVGDSLRLDEYVDYAQAFMASLKPRRLVLGRDTRLSGDMLRHLVCSAAIASGVQVFDLGIVPTPTVGLMVRKLRAGGGIALTASHNPAQWNALKFFSASGTFLTPAQFRDLLTAYETRAFSRATIDQIGCIETVADPIGPHLEALLKALPVKAIRAAKFRVALDACNGAGLGIAQELFKELGVKLGVIFADQHRKFEREAEPLPKNLGKLSRAVRQFKADIGFALDPDADRLAIVDEKGRAIGEERTIVLAADFILAGSKKPVVVNLSTTRAVDDVASRHGVRVERTPIGEAHVVDRMKAVDSTIGGEGNGGVIFPKVHFGRDSATGMGLVLALLASSGSPRSRKTLSQVNASIPDYVMVKDKIDLPERSMIDSALSRLSDSMGDLGGSPSANSADGLKISLADRWLHVRASGTEPIMRLFAEAPTRKAAQELISWAQRIIV